MKTTYRRRQLIVDLRVQGGITRRLVAYWLATALFAAGVTIVLQYVTEPVNDFGSYLLARNEKWLPIVIAMGLMLPIAMLDIAKFSHRFAGPIVRLRRSMRRLAAGEDVPPIEFRRGDYWHELATEFNQLSATVHELRRQLAAGDQPPREPLAIDKPARPAAAPLVAPVMDLAGPIVDSPLPMLN